MHEFLLAILNDELVTVRNDESEEKSEPDDAAQADSSVDASEEKTEKELLLGLFVDECRRYRYTVDV